jgi:hypothetical protein
MKEVTTDKALIAFCGLYCGACNSFLKDKCPGCKDNVKATWCAVRTCNLSHNYNSCADCNEFSNAKECKKFNNPISKIFGFVFRSDRNACIEMIKQKGYESFASYMAENKLQAIRRA